RDYAHHRFLVQITRLILVPRQGKGIPKQPVALEAQALLEEPHPHTVNRPMLIFPSAAASPLLRTCLPSLLQGRCYTLHESAMIVLIEGDLQSDCHGVTPLPAEL